MDPVVGLSDRLHEVHLYRCMPLLSRPNLTNEVVWQKGHEAGMNGLTSGTSPESTMDGAVLSECNAEHV